MLGNSLRIPDLAVRRKSGAAPFVFPELQPLIASAVADLDATNASSYSGSGKTWANLVAAPADGSGQTAYDMWLGTNGSTDGSEPTFVGTADSQSALFTLDGADWFTAKANTALINNANKTTGGNPYSIAVVGKFPARVVDGFAAGILGTGGFDENKNGIAVTNGVFGQTNYSYLFVSGANGAFRGEQINSASDITDGTYKVLVFCFDVSNSLAAKAYHGDSTPLGTVISFINSVADAADPLQVGACSVGNTPAPAGSEIIAVSQFNSFLTDANVTALRGMYSERHGRVY